MSLYRKYRPVTFSTVWGQDHITRTLKNAVASRRIDVVPAYLFVGTRGSGKTSCARILARAANCESPSNGDPCNRCESCRSIIEERTTDVWELDAATNRSVEDVERLASSVIYRPSMLRRKVYIIDEIHQLSSTAKDALLKPLEECPQHALFILATTAGNRVPDTVRSRCTLMSFASATVASTAGLLKAVLDREGWAYDDRGLDLIARLARGSYRDALSIAEGVHQTMGSLTLEDVRYSQALPDRSFIKELVLSIVGGDCPQSVALIEGVLRAGGVDVDTFLVEVADMIFSGARSVALSGKPHGNLDAYDIMKIGTEIVNRHKDYAGESPAAVATLSVIGAASLAKRLNQGAKADEV